MINRVTGLRGVAEAAFNDALLAADPEEAVHRHFRMREGVLRVGDVDYFLAQFSRTFLIGAGKASVRMAAAVERILGHKLSGGLVIARHGQGGRLKDVLVREAAHPLPDQDGVRATEEMIELVEPLTERDLVICVLSGGGSALLSSPVEGVDIGDLQRMTKLMLGSGMTIHEINTVRKHLSRIKGGRLAEKIHPATCITLILSDVVGDNIEVIASGPTAPDPTTFGDAIATLERRGLWIQAPASIRDALTMGEDGKLPETPKPGDDIFKRVHHQIVGSNRLSLIGCEQKAHRMGMNTMLLSSSVSGESREIAHFYAALAREIRANHQPIKPPCCLVAGGETTVTLRGNGAGGRCQELALAVALELADVPGAVFMAAGTDGIDGASDAAGAFADSLTVERAQGKNLDPVAALAGNDSHNFFKAMGDLVSTGPTGTNVMDIHLLLIG